MFDKRWIGILPNSVTTANSLVGVPNVLGTATASSLMDKQGRKSLLITSSKHFTSGAWQHGGGDADDQLYEDMIFDRCFYIYGGPEQLQ
ncbi:hypothetical protein Nepgr_023241 [Nepenthes gracilis]|uniref:Uncharacterized protein n=1 Tax=Nepenthes gracilis TaxID=150966 RepID=A0AAD3T2G7_NEPGR|nr:hypothetical protein Nepgr_023241 [Nepenthes gracilis]